jgi:preprotein translocase subunit SecA
MNILAITCKIVACGKYSFLINFNLKNLSHDELRQKTTEFRERISDYLSDIDDAIENLRQQTIDSEELSDKENLFLEIE